MSEFKPFTGKHGVVTAAVLKALIKRCHAEEVTSIEPYGDFFGCNTWRIQSYSHAAGALQKPDGTLLIQDSLCWPFLPEHVPHAEVHFTNDNSPEVNFYLRPKLTPEQEGCPDWHLYGDWPEFYDVFEEGCENNFDSPFSRTETEAKLRALGFDTFINH